MSFKQKINLSLMRTKKNIMMNTMRPTVLIAEDEASQRFTFHELCKRAGYDVIEAKDGAEALYFLKQDETEQIQILLTDLNMPKLSGIELIKEARALRAGLPIIVLTSSQETDDAVESMQAGANDFISKPVDSERLRVSIQNVLQTENLRHQVKQLTRESKGSFGFDDLIGHNAGLEATVKLARKIAHSDLPVLISGESGAGKEVLAQAIHGESSRSYQPFMAVNCGAIPANLAESVLFGHEKGAFTGAIAKSLGKFREAQGGTLFLDEIGELPLETQAKLLRALQNKEIEPVGLGRPVSIDVRIISATHRNLAEAVAEKLFREDLFYRLNVLPIGLPALRDRKNDIPELVEYFCDRLSSREGVPKREINADAMQLMQNHPWVGNVRELENCVSRALLLASGETITREDVEPLLQPAGQTISTPDASPNMVSLTHGDGSHKTLEEIEQEAIDVHGITNEFLVDKPRFADVVNEFLEFIDGAQLVIHNAAFDIGFLNAELRWAGLDKRIEDYCTVLDTLAMARTMYPGQRNTLDALCKRLDINNAHRTLHGALLDSEILADVYLMMTGGQTALVLDSEEGVSDDPDAMAAAMSVQPAALRVVRAAGEELEAHAAWLETLGKSGADGCLWDKA